MVEIGTATATVISKQKRVTMDTDNVQSALTICFSDGSKMRFVGPKQSHDQWDAMRKMQLILDKPYLAVEMDGSVVVIPTANIKYFQFAPKPEVIPEFFLRGVEMIEG